MSTLFDGDDAADYRHDGAVPQPVVDPGLQPGQVEPVKPATDQQSYDDR